MIHIILNVRFGSKAAIHYIYLAVRFQYKADIRVDCSERLLSSESRHSAKPIELLLSAKSGHSNY